MWQSSPTFMFGRPSRAVALALLVGLEAVGADDDRFDDPAPLADPAADAEHAVVNASSPDCTTQPSETRLSLIIAPLIRAAGRKRMRV